MSISSSALSKKTYKIVLLGDSSTGKTSIIDRFVNNKFELKDNVLLGLASQPSALTSWEKMSPIMPTLADCNYGIQLARNVIEVSSQPTLKMPSALSLSSTLQVLSVLGRGRNSEEFVILDRPV